MKLNRRTFLQATGVSLALPALDAMGGTASLVNQAPPKRMIMVCTSLGLHGPSFFPEGTGRSYKPSKYLKILEEHRNDFTVFSGMSHPEQSGADGHSSEMTWLTGAVNPGLGGFRNSISVDQLVRQKLGYVTRFPSINLSTGGTHSQSYTSNGVMVPAEYRPSVVFQKMFLQGKPNELKQQRARLQDGQSILDSLGDQVSELNSHLGQADRNRLDEYFQSIRSAEKRFKKAEQWLDVPKPKVDSELPEDIKEENDLIGRTNLLMDLIPLMVQTDSTRMITVLIQGGNDVPPIAGVSMDHHNLSHHGQDEKKIAQLMRIESELMKSFSGLLSGLKSKKEATGTLLDNTMVCFGSNLGNANSHDWRNLPILLAGGGLPHGQHLQFSKEDNLPLSNLFVRMMQEMKLEIDQFSTSSGVLTW